MPTLGTLQLHDEAATRAVGAVCAKLLMPGDAIALVGDLGAGKTALVAGAVAALGVTTASSPSYALVNEYAGRDFPIWHIDLYRLQRASELPALGLDDVIGDRRGVSFVEWADKFPVMPATYLELQLHHAARDTGRQLTIIGHGVGRGMQLAAALLRDAAALVVVAS